jgi:hypothetical protein
VPRVYNQRIETYPAGAVQVGSPSRWANPFRTTVEAQRDAACDAYELWLQDRPELVEAMKRELRGKDLVCWCSPKRCHADTILRIANA